MKENTNHISQIYCGGELYSGGDTVINDLKASGFTSVVTWALHVESDGSLIYNNPPIVRDGKYIGNADWPEQLASLKLGTTSVNRLTFSIGGWDVSDFANIKALMTKYGTGSDNPLYKNLKALKETIPSIDFIDFDDESLYCQDTTVRFSLMLESLGYKVTFCPYMEMEFWVECLYILNQKSPGLVEAFNLQCYAGGSYNNPQDWVTAIQNKMGAEFNATSFVYPGLWCRHGDACIQGDCPTEISQKIENWNDSINGLQGGFIWLYSDIQSCENSTVCDGNNTTAAYASAILNGLTPQDKWIEKKNVAEYKGASWDNHVKTITSTTVEEAKQFADENSGITYFFYCRGGIILEPNYTFAAGTAVFFSGVPWYGSAQQCDAFEKLKL